MENDDLSVSFGKDIVNNPSSLFVQVVADDGDRDAAGKKGKKRYSYEGLLNQRWVINNVAHFLVRHGLGVERPLCVVSKASGFKEPVYVLVKFLNLNEVEILFSPPVSDNTHLVTLRR